MKFSMHNSEPRITIFEFAEQHDLTMEVRDRGEPDGPARYYARFANSDIKEDCFLIGTYGDGDTVLDAIKAYCSEIEGKELVIQALDGERKEIYVPMLRR